MSLAKTPDPLDLGDDLLEPSGGTFAGRDDLDAPAFDLGIALVHPEKITGEKGCLVAPRAGADFENGAFFIRHVLGQKRDLELAGEHIEPHFALATLGLGQFAHLGFGRGISDHGLQPSEFAGHRPVITDGGTDGFEPRQLARQRDKCRGVGVFRQAARNLVVAAQDQVEFVLGKQHDVHA